jgi:hypothetical protein
MDMGLQDGRAVDRVKEAFDVVMSSRGPALHDDSVSCSNTDATSLPGEASRTDHSQLSRPVTDRDDQIRRFSVQEHRSAKCGPQLDAQVLAELTRVPAA